MKPLFSSLLLTVLLLPALAQKQWELRVAAGYDFSTVSQYGIQHSSNTSLSNNSRVVNTSLARGIAAGATATWWLSRYVGIVAGGSYHSTTPAVKGTSFYNLGIDAFGSTESKWNTRVALAEAGFALTIPDTKLNPYTRLSLLLPVYARVSEDVNWGDATIVGFSNGSYKKTYRLRHTAGYNAAVGIAPLLNKHIALLAEINLQSLSILVRHSSMTSYVEKGVEKIETLTVSSKEVDFVKKINYNYPYSPGQPAQELTYTLPYSSIGLRVGVAIKL